MRILGVLTVLAAQPGVASAQVTIAGYVETYYQAHFQDPENRITNFRGYDSRSRTFTVSNAVLDGKGVQGPVTARVALQVGHTPATYYLVEPVSPGTSSVDTSDGVLWRSLQIATLAYAAPRDLTVEAGLFLSPIGPEVIPIKDNLNWSRSNLFFALPTYHAGARVAKPLGGGWSATFMLCNGWGSVVDNNGEPSVSASAAYASKATTAQLLYFGGNERPTDTPEGSPWRHLFDAYIQHAVTDRLTLAVHGDAGFEANDLGTTWWAGAAGYAKYAFAGNAYVAARADYLREDPDGGAIVLPTAWVASGTATVAYQPAHDISVRLEYRHDHADGDLYFGGEVAVDPRTLAFVPDRDRQDTLTLGATAWF